jgi:hypothetical protein
MTADECKHHQSLCAEAEISFTEMEKRYQERFVALGLLIETRFAALEAKIKVAQETLTKWQDEHNDFRKQIDDERRLLATKAELQAERRQGYLIAFISAILVGLIVATLVAKFIRP